MVALVVLEGAVKNISVEQSELSFNFLVVFPLATKYCPLCKEVVALAMLFALDKLSDILVLIGILKIADPMRHLPMKFPGIHTAIRINYSPLSFLNPINKLPHIHKPHDLILVVAVAMLDTVVPLPLIVLLGGVEDPCAVLEVV